MDLSTRIEMALQNRENGVSRPFRVLRALRDQGVSVKMICTGSRGGCRRIVSVLIQENARIRGVFLRDAGDSMNRIIVEV